MKPRSAWIDDSNMILSTDFYQLTMCAAYYQYNLEHEIKEENDISVFELFVRDLPENRNYLIFAGLEQILYFIQNAHFTEKTIEYLRNQRMFRNIDSSFFNEYLPNFKFELDVWAMKEGTIFFPNEPVLQVRGPSPQAQLLETYVISVMNYQSIVATKASRIRNIAPDKILLEFGTRRGHSPQAGLYAARASYIGGFDGTSNVTADLELGIEASGTMAHSFVEKYGEMESFKIFYKYYKEDSILLIDTYDISEGAQKATNFGNDITGVRVDSGDLSKEAKRVRRILDRNGCNNQSIVLSSNLDEYKIKKLLDKNTPVKAFGIGTELITSSDAPKLGAVYKLMEHNSKPKIKISEGKETYPSSKQVYRFYDNKGKLSEDLLALKSEEKPKYGDPLLIPMMEKGKLLYDLPKLNQIREFCLENLEKLPDNFKNLQKIKEKKLKISTHLEKLWTSLVEKHKK
ncbi:MAG: nicotinate phosphoribosyltransferase [Candidatus Lokiarchaeota archaeon]|nr:nicotinate phosphoribosyltransferase [Candidatus Lokiarchaeota archaeon]MBD3339708.1 nicotinate phosphoribosyltransferase [Candidatus Lokiarchaeota archaeon]